MNERFHLEDYSGVWQQHFCPQCGWLSFLLFVDRCHRPLAEECGHCSTCGYTFTPEQYLADHPHTRPKYLTEADAEKWKNEPEVNTIPIEYAWNSIRIDIDSNLVKYLRGLYPADRIKTAIYDYWLGVTHDGSVIYPQLDESFHLRTGKIMQYNPETGHRVKDKGFAGGWMHSLLIKAKKLPEEWELTQCLFGLHLMNRYDKPICIVEAEKTAVIMSMEMPEYLWMACGGKSNLSAAKMQPLIGVPVTLFPDVDGYAEWAGIAAELNQKGFKINVSDHLDKTATEAERLAKIDIADRVLSYRERHPLIGPAADFTGIDEQTADAVRACISPGLRQSVCDFIREFGLQVYSRSRKLN